MTDSREPVNKISKLYLSDCVQYKEIKNYKSLMINVENRVRKAQF